MGSSDSKIGAAGLFFLLMLCLGESSPSESIGIERATAKAWLLQVQKRADKNKRTETELG
jgi:hypothetical protein